MKPYQRGDVVIIDVPMLANSHIQAGKRPWVIVQNNVGNQFSPTILVVPLTTKIKRMELPTHVAVTWGALQPSMAECEQVRVVDVSDDWEYICTLPPEIMRHVDTALKNAFFYERGVDDAPSADVAPVVRCKDCRYFKMYKCRMGYSSHDDFCSYGERKEGAEC